MCGGGIFKSVSKIFKKAAPYIGIAAAPFTGGASLGATIASGLSTASTIYNAINGAQSLLGRNPKEQRAEQVGAAQAPVYTPVRPQAATLPGSLGDIGNYSVDQQRSALATKGLNQGLGDDENAYYKNLVQRSLIGEGNKVTGSVDSLLPVEQQYFGKQGYNMGDINEFLRSISN